MTYTNKLLLAALQSLLLRQNLLTSVSDIAKLASASGTTAFSCKAANTLVKYLQTPVLLHAVLQELVLYDNNVSQVMLPDKCRQ